MYPLVILERIAQNDQRGLTRRVKILYAEDNQTQAEIIKDFLDLGLPAAELDHVETLAEAEAKLKNDSYDIVLLDLGLPDAEGSVVVQGVHTADPKAKIIVLTAQGEEESARQCLKIGASEYLVKRDVTYECLLKAIASVTSEGSESIQVEVAQTLEELRAMAGKDSDSSFEQFGKVYSRLISEPRFVKSSEHRKFAEQLVSRGLSGADALALHADSLESVCKQAERQDLASVLKSSQTVLTATLVYMIDAKRSVSEEKPL